MNNSGYKQASSIEEHEYELTVSEEQIVYEEEYHGETVEEEEVPCFVMENSFNLTPEIIYAVNQDHSICHFCKEDLTNKRFYNHLFDHHGFTKAQCEMMKQQKRLEISKSKPNVNRKKLQKMHECPSCGLEFITKTGLTNHLKKIGKCCTIHQEEPEDVSPISNIVCPSYGCDKNVATYLDLAIHVDTEHRFLSTMMDSFRIRRVTFPDKVSFMRWKKQMETATHSEFFLRTSQKVTFAVRTFLYKCLFSNSRGQSKGRRCEQCPAFIKCCQRNHGQFEVVACFGHLGHEHPTETAFARSQRIAKYREIGSYIESQMHNEELKEGEEQVLVDEYGNPENEGMMILMPGDGVVEEEEVPVDEHFQIVDDADDEIVGPQKPPVYVESNPGPSSHY